MRRSLRLLAPAVALALATSGCVSVTEDVVDAAALSPETQNDPKVPIGPGGEITVDAFEFGFDVSGTTQDGPIVVNLDNTGAVIHNFTIDDAAGEVHAVEAAGGESATGELLLFGPGEYTFYCSIPGHRSAGMVGTIEVGAEGDPVTVGEEA